MTPAEHIAKHFREIYFGGNWTSVSLRESLADVDWQQATAKLGAVNTIASLVYHTNYYVRAVSRVLRGEPLSAKDAYSFDCPPISSEADWQKLLATTWDDGQTLAALIQKLPAATLEQYFTDEKYGSYYRNLHGVIEHTHYHVGQIVLIKKLLSQ